jgi:endonuclease/exonuclease/phosphatase family metal-dependent hydrolase
MFTRAPSRLASIWVLLSALSQLEAAETLFTVASYNVENYLESATGGRPVKSSESKAKVRESIRTIHPDVLALQEVGGTNELLELRASLKAEGQDYPYWELVAGWDTNIQVAVVSRFPIVARRPHPNENYLLRGRRFHVSRGFLEVDVRVTPAYVFTLLTAHLKSRRQSPRADEAEMREQEAALLREIIDGCLNSNPKLNLVVLGDFNDVKDSRSTKIILGARGNALIDTRPAERNGDAPGSPTSHFSPRNVTWTHYYGKEDTYSRIDYILLSRGMAREWKTNGTYVLTLPNWGLASDHRPIIASFVAEDR